MNRRRFFQALSAVVAAIGLPVMADDKTIDVDLYGPGPVRFDEINREALSILRDKLQFQSSLANKIRWGRNYELKDWNLWTVEGQIGTASKRFMASCHVSEEGIETAEQMIQGLLHEHMIKENILINDLVDLPAVLTV